MKGATKTLGKLVDYITAHAATDIRPGETAADVAIRWHSELVQLRNMRTQRAAMIPKHDDPEWKKRLTQCEAILSRLDDLPMRAEDFVESVREGVSDVAEWITERKDVTAAQCVALDNWERGIEKWIR